MGHQSSAPAILCEAGLLEAFASPEVIPGGDVALPAPQPQRGPSSLINEPALIAQIDALSARVPTVVEAGRFPFVYGGDCSALLGIMPGLRKLGPTGLVFIDGHEDTMPLDVSEDGEAANTEIGLLLGLTGRLLTGSLAKRLSTLHRTDVALLGQRDDDEPNGLNWGALTVLLTAAVDAGGCVGWNCAISRRRRSAPPLKIGCCSPCALSVRGLA